MVQQVEKLCAELKLLALYHADILEHREVPIRIARALRNVSACSSKLLYRRVRVLNNLLKSAAVQPCSRGTRSRVGILPGDEVRPVGEESTDFWRRALYRKIGGVGERDSL